MSVHPPVGADGHRPAAVVGPYRKDRSKVPVTPWLPNPLTPPGKAETTTSPKILLSGHLLC